MNLERENQMEKIKEEVSPSSSSLLTKRIAHLEQESKVLRERIYNVRCNLSQLKQKLK